QGWSLIASTNVSTTLIAGLLVRIADGTEGGLALQPAGSPSEKWCVSALALQDVDLYRGFGGVWTFSTGSANLNQGAVPTFLAGDDVMYTTALAGEGTTATTGIPAGYTSQHSLNNAAADGASLVVATKVSNTGSEN